MLEKNDQRVCSQNKVFPLALTNSDCNALLSKDLNSRLRNETSTEQEGLLAAAAADKGRLDFVDEVIHVVALQSIRF